jgi:hypothetical protein
MKEGTVIMEEQVGDLFVQPRRELARRVSGGIEVALYWSPLDNTTTVEVWDLASEETLVFAGIRATAATRSRARTAPTRSCSTAPPPRR